MANQNIWRISGEYSGESGDTLENQNISRISGGIVNTAEGKKFLWREPEEI